MDAGVGKPCLGQLWVPQVLQPIWGCAAPGLWEPAGEWVIFSRVILYWAKVCGIKPPSQSPQHWQICSGSAGKELFPAFLGPSES